jgi:hypothetical protein
MDDSTWVCHVCGKERPDDKISVHSTKKMVGDVEITQNVRYCNDNPDCVEGAKTVNWINS